MEGSCWLTWCRGQRKGDEAGLWQGRKVVLLRSVLIELDAAVPALSPSKPGGRVGAYQRNVDAGAE